MTLNSSGPISLGGSVTGQSINLEIGASSNAQVSLNDTNVRLLAQVPTGAIQMPTNFWGKKFSANSATFFMMGGGGAATGGGVAGQSGGGQMVGQNGQAASVTGGISYSIVVGGAGSNSSVFNGAYTAIAGGNAGSGGISCTNGGSGACGGSGGIGLVPGSACSGGAGIYGGNGGTPAIWINGPGVSWACQGGSGGLGGSGTNGSIVGNPYGGGSLYGGNGGPPAYSTFNPSGASIAYGGGIAGTACIVSDGPNTNCYNGTTYGTPAANTGYGGQSGIVIIRVSNAFPQPSTTGSPSIVNSGGYYWFTFTGSGTITF